MHLGSSVIPPLMPRSRGGLRVPDRALEPLRVLVVDDERLIRWSVGETLTALGHRVLEAADAASTRRLLEELESPVDVVLLDYRLPDSDDLTLLKDIRRISRGTAVVMMTACGTLEIAASARALGAYALVEKPFDMLLLEPALLEARAAARREWPQEDTPARRPR